MADASRKTPFISVSSFFGFRATARQRRFGLRTVDFEQLIEQFLGIAGNSTAQPQTTEQEIP
jgi:hypothetical protein